MSAISRIAVAEDHPVFRSAVCNLINGWADCNVTIQAATGIELLAQLKQKNGADLVLLDIRMPEMDGFETIKKLKNEFSLLKVLIFSNYDTYMARSMMLQCGADGFVSKVAPIEQMQEIVYAMLAGESFTELVYSNKERQIPFINELANLHLEDREIQFFKLLCTGLTYKEIATALFISNWQLEYMRQQLFERYDKQTRSAMVKYIIESGIL